MKDSDSDFASFEELNPIAAALLPPGVKLQVSKRTFAQFAEIKLKADRQKVIRVISSGRNRTKNKARILQATKIAETA